MVKSVEQWIDEQDWPEETKRAALMTHGRRAEKGLHPLTRGQWSAWRKSFEHHTFCRDAECNVCRGAGNMIGS